MKLYELEPEVAGGFGQNTIVANFDNVRQKRDRPIVSHLHYEFSGWLGDEILETTPCFIVTISLAETIKNSDLKGYYYEEVETSVTDEFKELYPEKALPEFKRIIPKGSAEVNGDCLVKWSGDDFCLSQRSTLVVSEKALHVLQKHKLNYCDMKELIFEH